MIAASIVRLVAFSWARTVKPSSRNRCAIARTSFTGLRSGDSRYALLPITSAIRGSARVAWAPTGDAEASIHTPSAEAIATCRHTFTSRIVSSQAPG